MSMVGLTHEYLEVTTKKMSEDNYEQKSLLDQRYPPCKCGMVPEWYCSIWSDKPLSMCLKEDVDEDE
jgi:hypothetical protein